MNELKNYRVIYPKNYLPAEKTAAYELAAYLEKMCGCSMEIFTDDIGEREYEICVGNTCRTAAPIPENAEGYTIYSEKNNLFIVGGSDRGTLYGVYDYLRMSGCRFYSVDTEIIPNTDRLILPPEPVSSSPAFEYRDTFWSCSYDTALSAKLHLNGCVGDRDLPAEWGGGISYAGNFVHSLPLMLPPEEYFDKHPEYFSLINGKRVGERLYTQLCLTNEDVYQIVLKRVRDWLHQFPEAKIISVSQDDAYTLDTYCTCPECAKVNEEEQTPGGTLFRFVNRIAEDIEEEFPDVAIDTLAYQYSIKPPVITKPRKNVIIRYCTGSCSHHAVTECESNAHIVKNIEAWNRICGRIYIWNYTTNFAAYLSPYPNFDAIAEDTRFFSSHGVLGLFQQGMYQEGRSGEFGGLRAYCMARLLWEPQLDMKALMKEFCDAYYGEASDCILRYIDIIQTRFSASGKHMNISFQFGDIFDRNILDAKTVDECDGIWQSALKAAKELQNEHVRRSMLSWRFAKISLGYSGSDEYEAWKRDAAELGVTRYNEGAKFSDLS